METTTPNNSPTDNPGPGNDPSVDTATEPKNGKVNWSDLEGLSAHIKADPGFVATKEHIGQLAGIYKLDPPQWTRISAVLRAHKLLQSIRTLVEQEIKSVKSIHVAKASDSESVPVSHVIKDAPVDKGLVVPRGWQLRDEQSPKQSLFRLDGCGDDVRWSPVCSRPCILTSWISNETTRSKAVEVAWKGCGKWHTAIVSLEQISDSSKILAALCNRGMPVHSNNRADVVQWFADYLSANISRMPVHKISEQMGWCGDRTFLIGDRKIGEDNDSMSFYSADPGISKMGECLKAKGDWLAWSSAMGKLRKYPRAQLALYASLATPLLKILGVPSFAVDFSYRTSSGKTSVLKIAASVWGNPNERGGASLLSAWDATQTWIERAAEARCDLPMILDDSKRAMVVRGKSLIPSIVYAVTNGEGRGRGTIHGTQHTTRWRTILISSGEHRLIDESQDGGTPARVLSVWGNPWCENSPAVAEDIHAIMAEIDQNYGMAGPYFVEHLLANPDEWDLWRMEYEQRRADWSKRLAEAGCAGTASRVSAYIAVLELAENIAHEALMLNTGYDTDCVEKCFVDLADGPKDADRSREAMEFILGWAVSNRGQFANGASSKPPHGPLLGRWDVGDAANGTWDWIGILPHCLHDALRGAGHEPKSTVKLWAERGWLKSQSKRVDLVVRVDSSPTKVIAIPRSVVSSFFDEGQENENGNLVTR